jgi:hypothetical protein
LTVASARIRSSRFATDRRGGSRLQADLSGWVEATPVRLTTSSLSGGVLHSAQRLPDAGEFMLVQDGDEIRLRYRCVHSDDNGEDEVRTAVRFADGQWRERERLALVIDKLERARHGSG